MARIPKRNLKLVGMLRTGDEFNIFGGDVQSFEWIVNVGNPTQHLGLGGGNLTVALVSISNLSNIAKCYVILNRSYQLLNSSKGLSSRNIDETDAFVQLIINNANSWGATRSQLRAFWKRVRHKLVHTAYAKAVIYPPYFHGAPKPPFEVKKGTYLIFSDHLWSSYLAIKSILIENIEAGRFHSIDISKALKYAKGNL